LTFTHDLDLQSPASYDYDPYTLKIEFKSQSVKNMEWKQTDRQTNGHDRSHYHSH